jgi:hypothetical protein
VQSPAANNSEHMPLKSNSELDKASDTGCASVKAEVWKMKKHEENNQDSMSSNRSGKTAAFIIPMLNKLKSHSKIVGKFIIYKRN